LKILVEKRSIRLNETTHGDQLILVDPVDDEDEELNESIRIAVRSQPSCFLLF
jgi:hypothetical protein